MTVCWLVKRNMADSKSAKPILSGQSCMVGARQTSEADGLRKRRISAMCKTESVQMQGTRERADVPKS